MMRVVSKNLKKIKKCDDIWRRIWLCPSFPRWKKKSFYISFNGDTCPPPHVNMCKSRFWKWLPVEIGRPLGPVFHPAWMDVNERKVLVGGEGAGGLITPFVQLWTASCLGRFHTGLWNKMVHSASENVACALEVPVRRWPCQDARSLLMCF